MAGHPRLGDVSDSTKGYLCLLFPPVGCAVFVSPHLHACGVVCCYFWEKAISAFLPLVLGTFWVCSSEQQMLLLTPPGNPWYCKQRQRKSPSLCPSQDPQQPFYSPWKPRVGSAAINRTKCGIVPTWKVFLKQRKYQLKKTEDKVTHNPFILVNYMVKVSQT